MTNLRTWLEAVYPGLVIEFDQYQRTDGAHNLDGWLFINYNAIWRQWRARRVEVAHQGRKEAA